MNLLQYRPGTLAGTRLGPFSGPLLVPLLLSVVLHFALLAWLQPRSAGQRDILPRFDVQVRLAPQVTPVLPVLPVHKPAPVLAPPLSRNAAAAASARPGPLPPPLDQTRPEPLQAQPLRVRIVANPAEYGFGDSVPGRPYAWMGELAELPYPASGWSVRYPEEQLRGGRKGLVVARVDLSSAGQIEKIDILCGSGPFDVAVLDALRAAPFRPPMSSRGPVPAWTVIEFAFLAEPEGETAKDPRRTQQAFELLQKDCAKPK